MSGYQPPITTRGPYAHMVHGCIRDFTPHMHVREVPVMLAAQAHWLLLTVLCLVRLWLQSEAGQGSSTKLGMPCTTCLHPTCKHSPSQQGVMACPECR